MRKDRSKDFKSLVIKVGTSILTTRGRFDKTLILRLAEEISGFVKKGRQVAVVSSGAIGAGMTILKEKERPKTMQGLQAAAAVGQRYLMQCYEEAFSKRGLSTAQVLLTWDDFRNQARLLNAKNTLHEIQRRGLVPIINENDTIATDEIRFGDNDRLSAHIAILLETDLLVILSDTDGLYADGGKGRRIECVEKMDRSVYAHVQDNKRSFTVGGMRSKLEAAEMGVSSGIPVFLADGRQKKVLRRLIAGESLGTFFAPRAKKAHRQWMEHFVKYKVSL